MNIKICNIRYNFIIFILLITIFKSQQQLLSDFGSNLPAGSDLSCSLNSCSVIGEPCSKTSKFSGFQCYVQDRCLNGTCVPSLKQDEECEDSGDCGLGYSCVTPLSSLSEKLPNKTKTCQPSFYADFGDNCTRATDCLNSLDCIDGICTTPRYGCISDLSCRNGDLCNNTDATCYTPILQSNECLIFRSYSCQPYGNPCALKDFNVSSIGVCKNLIEIGSPCLTTLYTCDYKFDQFCQPLSPGSVLGKCALIPKNETSIRSCTSPRECLDYEYCKCDTTSGVGFCASRYSYIGRFCQQASLAFFQCAQDLNCTFAFSINPRSCIYQSKCIEQAKCLNLFCTDPILPVSLCISKTCEITIFNETDIKILVISSSTKLNNNLNLIMLFIVATFNFNKLIF